MAKGLSAAQRRAVTGSDPSTGRLSARSEVCGALVAAGLAVPHGRGGHHYLTPEGLRIRAALAAEPVGGEVGGGGAVPPPGPADGFVADGGTGAAAPGRGGDAGRAAEVAAAWEGLLQIRALLMDGATDLPAPWEKDRCVHAISLALEANGCPPAHSGTSGAPTSSGSSALPGSPERPGPSGAPGPDMPPGSSGSPGYTVTPSPYPGTARVTWSPESAAADALPRVARLLIPYGWQSTQHRTRSAHPYLLVTPHR